MYVLIDNYDSFTYNIYQYLSEITDKEIRVIRNDAASVDDIKKMDPDFWTTIHLKRPNRRFMGYNHNTYCNLGQYQPPRTEDPEKVTCPKCIFKTTDLSMEEAKALAERRKNKNGRES